MTPQYVIQFFTEAIMLALMLSLPPLILGLVVGVVIAIFQTVTQIQEQTLVIVPKMVAIIAGLLLFGGWMLDQLTTYTVKVFSLIPSIPG
jgi:flagellar biosynthetic protein FliQ